MRIVIVGAVQSAEKALCKLIEHKMNVVGVFGFQAASTAHVSGYVDLEVLSAEAGIPFFPFASINQHADQLAGLKPDYLFVVGLSQLLKRDLLFIPTQCSIGFHPTKLPQGRGRAPLAWMLLESASEGAATFFRMTEGADEGEILAQSCYTISGSDNVSSLTDKVLLAMSQALDKLLPEIKSNSVSYTVQDNSKATYYGKRAPEDGCIDWAVSASSIDRLVRATSAPYPGAYTYGSDVKIIINKSEATTSSTKGVVGRILDICEKGFSVQCGDGVLRVIEYHSVEGWAPIVGQRLGVKVEDELVSIKKRITKLESMLDSGKFNAL
ncbi:hypothetical protein AB833_25955 [Chromatiales bacterium (ex Bugula neritina AB1)]|nr:hypothetical protein AB833_25955 [Chromatiales bacterium (ex Bugula neritina AB1)]